MKVGRRCRRAVTLRCASGAWRNKQIHHKDTKGTKETQRIIKDGSFFVFPLCPLCLCGESVLLHPLLGFELGDILRRVLFESVSAAGAADPEGLAAAADLHLAKAAADHADVLRLLRAEALAHARRLHHEVLLIKRFALVFVGHAEDEAHTLRGRIHGDLLRLLTVRIDALQRQLALFRVERSCEDLLLVILGRKRELVELLVEQITHLAALIILAVLEGDHQRRIVALELPVPFKRFFPDGVAGAWLGLIEAAGALPFADEVLKRLERFLGGLGIVAFIGGASRRPHRRQADQNATRQQSLHKVSLSKLRGSFRWLDGPKGELVPSPYSITPSGRSPYITLRGSIPASPQRQARASNRRLLALAWRCGLAGMPPLFATDS